MQDPLRVGEADGIANLEEDLEIRVESGRLAECLKGVCPRMRLGGCRLGDRVAPVFPPDQLHRVEQATLLIPSDIVNRNDVGVVEIPDHDRLFQGPARFARPLPRRHLDRDFTGQRQLHRPIHRPLAPLPQGEREVALRAPLQRPQAPLVKDLKVGFSTGRREGDGLVVVNLFGPGGPLVEIEGKVDLSGTEKRPLSG